MTPVVSVHIITYNHERFISQAVESALMQKTRFPVEIVVGDDGSTDDTQLILRELQSRFPARIKLLLHPNNLGPKNLEGKINFIETLKACDGKYVCFLDGDDYWTDPDKVQKQVDFLEAHPEFCMTFHDFTYLQEGSRETVAPKMQHQIAGSRNPYEIVRGATIHSDTVLSLNLFRDLPDDFLRARNGDTFLFAFMASKTGLGAAYLSTIKPSVYRLHAKGGWSAASDIRKKKLNIDTLLLIDKNIKSIYRPCVRFKLTSVIFSLIRGSLKAGTFRDVVQSMKYSVYCLVTFKLNFIRPKEY